MADLPRLDGPARFCLLSGSVPPSQTSLLATAVRIPTEQALEKNDTQAHTLFTLGILCAANTISASLSFCMLYKTLPHTEPLFGSHNAKFKVMLANKHLLTS